MNKLKATINSVDCGDYKLFDKLEKNLHSEIKWWRLGIIDIQVQNVTLLTK